MGIDRWPHGIRLDLFSAVPKRLNVQMAQKIPFLGVFSLLVRYLKITGGGKESSIVKDFFCATERCRETERAQWKPDGC